MRPLHGCRIDALEPRRLFAYDLVVSAIVSSTPFVATNSSAAGIISFRNKGGDNIQGIVTAKVFLTRDSIAGNGDDIPLDDIEFSAIFAGATDRFETTCGGHIPASTPIGRYFFAATVTADPDRDPDVNHANDTLISNAAVNIYSGAWPSATLTATAGDDAIAIHGANADVVTINGVTHAVPAGKLLIDAGSGNDLILADDDVTASLAITGSGGNDTIHGGHGNDELSGANGKDRVFGGWGNDYLLGGASGDYLYGDVGADTLSGAGGNDRIIDDTGGNYFLGGAGNDTLLARDNPARSIYLKDTLSGNAGTDSAQYDPDDIRSSIENTIP